MISATPQDEINDIVLRKKIRKYHKKIGQEKFYNELLKLDPKVKSFQNMNGNPFIRNLYNFREDIAKSLDRNNKIDITKF